MNTSNQLIHRLSFVDNDRRKLEPFNKGCVRIEENLLLLKSGIQQTALEFEATKSGDRRGTLQTMVYTYHWTRTLGESC